MRNPFGSIFRLLRKTTLTPLHLFNIFLGLMGLMGLVYWTHPLGWKVASVLGVVLFVWSVFVEPRLFRRRDYTHGVEKLKGGSIRLALLGDLHIGSPYATLDKLRGILQLMVLEKPDVLVLVGDYVIQGVIGGKHVPIQQVVNVLKKIDIPTVAIIGNHDVRDGRMGIHEAFADSPIQFLENDSWTTVLQGQEVTFVGLDDESTGTPLPQQAFPTGSEDGILITLAHDPATFLRQLPHRADLCLAGHTHGGQVRIPGIGAVALPGKSPLKWSYGWVDTSNGPLYVTSGFGTSIAPIRFCAPPEYVFITLKDAA